MKKKQGSVGLSTWWLRNIFCQFDHEQLNHALECCAVEIHCTTFHGEPGSIDICAVGSFVKIVDRNTVGYGIWKEYVEGIDSAGGDVPCIIIDRLSDLPLSRCQYVCQMDMNSPETIRKIAQTIKQMRKRLDKDIPALFSK